MMAFINQSTADMRCTYPKPRMHVDGMLQQLHTGKQVIQYRCLKNMSFMNANAQYAMND